MQKTKVCAYAPIDDYAQLGKEVKIGAETIAASFRYDSLVRRSVIPNLCPLVATLRAKKIPAPLETDHNHRKQFFRCLQSAYRGEAANTSEISDTSLQSYTEQTCAALVADWQEEYGHSFEFERVLTKGALSVTFDVITYTKKKPVVWFLSFEPWNAKTKERLILRALVNWVLMRGSRMTGLILVGAGKHLLFDLTGWSKAPLRKDIEQIIGCLLRRSCFAYRESLFSNYPAGNSVHVEGPLSSGLETWIQSCLETHRQVRPVQVFLANPFVCDPDYLAVRKLTTEFALPLFIHAPLNMNISGLSEGPIKILRSTLRLGQKMGARAVTVHAGRANQQGVEESLQRQAEVLRACLGESDPNVCLLCVETPCGKESDICTTFETMNSFFLEYFSEEERKRLGITIDTCHVFNAGNDPVKYMKKWLEKGSVQIGLCHWNDAQNFFGVGIEGHHNPDLPGGAIGYEAMEEIASLCVDYGVPFLFE